MNGFIKSSNLFDQMYIGQRSFDKWIPLLILIVKTLTQYVINVATNSSNLHHNSVLIILLPQE
jgi:hypothetical protein